MADAPSATVPELLLDLSRRRWSVPVLARLHPAESLAFGQLKDGLRASGEGLSAALDCLEGPGWIDRAPGRRGVYRLTPPGRRVAAPCDAVVSAVDALGLDDVAFRRWTLPIVAALRGWELRFAELRVLLPGISPRALALALKDLQAQGIVHRRVLGGFPPATGYRLTESGERLRGPVERLAAVRGPRASG